MLGGPADSALARRPPQCFGSKLFFARNRVPLPPRGRRVCWLELHIRGHCRCVPPRIRAVARLSRLVQLPPVRSRAGESGCAACGKGSRTGVRTGSVERCMPPSHAHHTHHHSYRCAYYSHEARCTLTCVLMSCTCTGARLRLVCLGSNLRRAGRRSC